MRLCQGSRGLEENVNIAAEKRDEHLSWRKGTSCPVAIKSKEEGWGRDWNRKYVAIQQRGVSGAKAMLCPPRHIPGQGPACSHRCQRHQGGPGRWLRLGRAFAAHVASEDGDGPPAGSQGTDTWANLPMMEYGVFPLPTPRFPSLGENRRKKKWASPPPLRIRTHSGKSRDQTCNSKESSAAPDSGSSVWCGSSST